MNPTSTTATDSEPRQLVVFSLGEEEYAFPITQVREIIRHHEPRTVSSSDPCVMGVISLRGRILPVCSLTPLLGAPASHGGKIVIVESAGHTAGVIVDEVREVLTVSADQIEAVPLDGVQAIDAIAKVGDRLIALLDSGVVLGADRGVLAA